MSCERMHCYVAQHGREWRAYCVEVALSAMGKTADDARRALDRLLEDHCHEVRENGTRAARSRGSIRRHLAYARACLRRGPDGDSLCYLYRAPPELLMGLA